MRRHLLVLVALGALGAACNDYGFETAEEITKLRTLAIVVDPPVVGPGDVARISSLTVDPTGAEIEYLWELCLFTDGPDAYYACSAVEGQGTAGFVLGETPTVALPYEALAAAGFDIRAVCEALGDVDVPDFVQLPSCDEGLELTLRLTARTASDEEIAVRPLMLLFDDTVVVSPNANPGIEGLLVNGRPVGEGSGLDVSAEEAVRLQLLVNTAEAETYVAVSEGSGAAVGSGEGSGQVEVSETREQLAVHWYATHGTLRRANTYFAEGIAPATELQFNRLNLTKGIVPEAGDRVEIFAVVRDTRGGVGWERFELPIRSMPSE